MSFEFDQEFQYFKILKQLSSKDNAASVLSCEEIELIDNLYSDQLTDQQVFCLFELGDKYLAIGKTKERILKLLANTVLDHQVNLPKHWEKLHLWKAF